MYDPEIRAVVKRDAMTRHPDIVLLDELPLRRGVGKADVVAVNGELIGYEIKSQADSLARLPRQIPLYDSVFEKTCAVLASKHVSRGERIIPPHWGLVVADRTEGGIVLRELRAATLNAKVNKRFVAMLMWKDEAIKLLRRRGVAVKSTAPVSRVWSIMLDSLSTAELLDGARCALKCRYAPGVASPQMPDGG